jgi:GT2 family glycosyltransferase
MNAGAQAASGEVLLFLHVDTRLPERAALTIREQLARPGVVAGAFRTRTCADGNAPSPAWLRLADLRSHYTRTPYGDQALFVRRDAFERVGGFPDLPLMEDYELSRRLRQIGRIAISRRSVRVSGRRFLERPLYNALLVNTYPLLYRLGVSPESLRRFYRDVR